MVLMHSAGFALNNSWLNSCDKVYLFNCLWTVNAIDFVLNTVRSSYANIAAIWLTSRQYKRMTLAQPHFYVILEGNNIPYTKKEKYMNTALYNILQKYAWFTYKSCKF